METYNFKSIFKEELTNYINFKKNIGYLYGDKTIANYKVLDDFFIEINLKEKIINNDIIEKWLSKSTNYSLNTKNNYYSIISMFTRYLVNYNYKNITVPSHNPHKKAPKFIPYIYAKKEINDIFANIYSKQNSCEKYYTLYMCICLLYCCGLRIGEVVNFKLCDFESAEHILVVKNGKNNVDRNIFLTNELQNLLTKYIQHKNINDKNAYLFYPNIDRSSAKNNIRRNFHETLKSIKIQKRNSGYYPRIHDLRHTFAINALERMINKGFDLYVSVSMLSIYLGHKSIVETEYYLKLIPENFNRITEGNKHLMPLYGKEMNYGK